jgi:hypothetical protein
MYEFAKPARDLIMMRPEFLGCVALGQKNAAIVVVAREVSPLQADIKRFGTMRHCNPCWRFYSCDQQWDKRWQPVSSLFGPSVTGHSSASTG